MTFRLAEDDEPILRMLSLREFCSVDHELVGFRGHGHNLSRSQIVARRCWSSRAIEMQEWLAQGRSECELSQLTSV